ncbi:enoyl-CoA hydratase/isomerase family protein [Psychrosphaera sp. 1_MG-2023]|uniref:enoyl-CoA hydratase/isomerase family protein n=2 Tax=Psychrosphaera TaxID=907197 RepID=UPI0026E25169|nr:enoyl-CoA hydratase/isomerase family protein [Psychrosphaera sp. 1_MG-2023]MDO6721045.1 enoyl-CoA hydratase/isomerase family protein [Psychrosphaera sp. 1_MG-2023]
MNEPVLFRELESVSGKKIGIATLNVETSLNALNLEMVKLLTKQLLEWQQRSDIALVMLEGSGGKAFCAGGDVVQLYKATVEAGKSAIAPYIETFFTQEYELDYLIHTFGKPILCWGHGIVMGGGLGLFAGASHRVVTQKSRIAMPEITIGLYPDVGGTYFLNKMPKGAGLFLALTGASINGSDAKFVQLADHFVLSEHQGDLIEEVLLVKWGDTEALNHQKLSDVLVKFEQKDQVHMPVGNISRFNTLLSDLALTEDVSSAVTLIIDHASDDKWMLKAQDSLAKGSPLTAHIIMKQLALGKSLSLADCFRLELGLSCNCSAIGEFAEGVRALLIDKDYCPSWFYETVHDVDPQMLNKMFTSPWTTDLHPLKDLGK